MASLMSSSTVPRSSMLSITSKCRLYSTCKHHRWLLPIRLIGDVLNVFRTISEDQDVRAIVLSGAGRLYTAGLDLSETQLKDKSSGDIARLTYAKRHHLQVDGIMHYWYSGISNHAWCSGSKVHLLLLKNVPSLLLLWSIVAVSVLVLTWWQLLISVTALRMPIFVSRYATSREMENRNIESVECRKWMLVLLLMLVLFNACKRLLVTRALYVMYVSQLASKYCLLTNIFLSLISAW